MCSRYLVWSLEPTTHPKDQAHYSLEKRLRQMFGKTENETSYSDGTRKHVLISNGQESTDREYVKVMTAQPTQATAQEVQRDQERYQYRPFSILR
jgi:hypothetical protein